MRGRELILGLVAIFGALQVTIAATPDGVLVSPEGTIAVPTGAPVIRGRSFVPLHSTVVAGGGRTRLNFSGSLSIYNTSARHVLVIDAIEYRDAAGRLVESYMSQPIGLRPFASMQVTIAQDDVRGGIAPSFIVDWSSNEPIDEPAIEAVMIAWRGTQDFSMVSAARRLNRP